MSLSAVSLSFFAMSGITFTLPFYFQILRGYSALQAGLCFLPFAIGQIIAAPRSAAMVDRFGYKRVMTLGLALVTLSLVGVSRMTVEQPLWTVLVIFFVFGFGMGNVIAPASTVMQNVLPLARAGAGSAVQNTVRQVFGALGVAIIGTVLATQYAKGVQPIIDKLPEGTPTEVVDLAKNSVGGTTAVLQGLADQGAPADVVAQGQQVAYDSFLNASHITGIISTVLVLVAALVVWFLLPPITPPQKGGHGGPATKPEGADRARGGGRSARPVRGRRRGRRARGLLRLRGGRGVHRAGRRRAPMTVVRTRAPGRPRDARVDALVLETALAMLAEVGPTGLSVEEVAARAGVGKSTIYRRWPTKDDLVVASLGALVMVPEDVPDRLGTRRHRLPGRRSGGAPTTSRRTAWCSSA